MDALVKEGAAAIRAAAAYDALTKSQQPAASAVNKLQDGYESLAKRLRDNIANSDSILNGTDKLTVAQKLQRDVTHALTHDLKKLDDTRKDGLQAMAAESKAKEADAKMMRQKQDIAERAASMQRQFAQMAQEQARDIARQNEGLSHGSKWNEQQSQIDAIADKYDRMRRSAEEAFRAAKSRGDDATVAQQALNAAIAQSTIEEEAAKAAARKGFAERDALQANWVTGAQRAMEDYRDRAKDTASQVADLFTNAATNMTDALVQFALTGKLSFKDFANSVIEDLARIAY